MVDIYRRYLYDTYKDVIDMKLIQELEPFYFLEIPFLISKALNYQSKGKTSIELANDKVMRINKLYPTYLNDYEILLKNSVNILEGYPEIIAIHKLTPLGTFTSIMYHLNSLNFEDLNLEIFTQAALRVLFDKFSESDIDSAHTNYTTSRKIMKDKHLDFNLLFKQFDNFDLENSMKYQILEYFSDIASIFENYKNLYNSLLKLYLDFYKKHANTVSDNIQPKTMDDLTLDRWIDVESFKDYSREEFYFTFSLINFQGLSAKLAVVSDELSFGMQGVFLDIFDEIEKENTVSITNIETQLSALGDSTRIRIFGLLLEGEYYLKELADALELSSSNLSHHMDILQSVGLVKMRAKGKKVYYSINPEEIKFILNFFKKVLIKLEEPL